MNIAILLSGGVGSRLHSNVPKQYLAIEGEMIVKRTLKGLLENALIDVIWVVSDKRWRDIFTEPVRGFSEPGANRQLSIYSALCDMSDIASDDDVVLIQDAVRPLTSQETITRCLTDIEGHDGALPVLTMKDTVYLSEDGRSISKLLKRDKLFAGQAPEAYRYGKYKKANAALLPDEILKISGAAEPAVMYGMDVKLFQGDEGNFKITTDEDLKRYKEVAKSLRMAVAINRNAH